MKQEQIMQMQMIEQEANQYNQQLQMIEQNISELKDLNLSLSEVENSNEKNNEILINLGKRLYLPVEIKKKELIVEVGKGTFTKKSISETKKIIENQIENLSNARIQINQKVGELQTELMSLMNSVETTEKKE